MDVAGYERRFRRAGLPMLVEDRTARADVLRLGERPPTALTGRYYSVALLTDSTYRQEFLHELTATCAPPSTARALGAQGPRGLYMNQLGHESWDLVSDTIVKSGVNIRCVGLGYSERVGASDLPLQASDRVAPRFASRRSRRSSQTPYTNGGRQIPARSPSSAARSQSGAPNPYSPTNAAADDTAKTSGAHRPPTRSASRHSCHVHRMPGRARENSVRAHRISAHDRAIPTPNDTRAKGSTIRAHGIH
jgi:hypothetical protein